MLWSWRGELGAGWREPETEWTEDRRDLVLVKKMPWLEQSGKGETQAGKTRGSDGLVATAKMGQVLSLALVTIL